MRIGLVGCVKSKGSVPAPARDLYTSALFRGRRAYVERSCQTWFILSAEHGLVDPDRVLAPYERSVTVMSRAEWREWSQNVLDVLRGRIGDLSQHTFEIHAGAAYRDFGLLAGLRQAGCQVEVPSSGLRQGEQLRFYRTIQ